MPPPNPTLIVIGMLVVAHFASINPKRRKAFLAAMDWVVTQHARDPHKFSLGRPPHEAQAVAEATGSASQWVQRLRARLERIKPTSMPG